MFHALRKSLIATGLLTALAMSPVQAVSPDELFEVLQRIESLENDVRFLRGENEQLRYDIEDVKNTQKSTFIRIDDRMDDLFRAVNTSKMSAPLTPIIPAPIAPAKKPKIVKPLQQVFVPKSAINKPAVVKAPVVQKTTVVKQPVVKPNVARKKPLLSSAEQVAYNAALSKVKTQPSAAMIQFRGFLKKYPQSSLAANAQYWLGEMMFSSRNYQGAIDEFVTVLQNYSASPKAPDAAVKLGYSFYAMKNWVYARRTLEDVMRNYPKTPAANLAQARLEKMKQSNLY